MRADTWKGFDVPKAGKINKENKKRYRDECQDLQSLWQVWGAQTKVRSLAEGWWEGLSKAAS